MKYDIEYKCLLFNEYDKKFDAVVSKDEGFKVYLLDMFSNTYHFESITILNKK